MRIVINYGRDNPFESFDENEQKGGLETAVLGLSAALACRGHDIHIFAPTSKPGRHNSVSFHDRREFASFFDAHTADVLLLIPEFLPVLMPTRVRARVLWSHDAYPIGDFAVLGPPRSIPGFQRSPRVYPLDCLSSYVDQIAVGSEWHASLISERAMIPPDRITVFYLGLPLHYDLGEPPLRHRYRLIYSSRPRRGLDILLRIFPSIKRTVPEAELHLCAYNSDAPPSGLKGLMRPGVVWRGSLTKSDLAAELRSAAVMAYPSTYDETFCLAVAEAHGAGLPVVTGRRAALAERVYDGVNGFLIEGTPDDERYQSAFANAVARLLRDDELWARMSENAIKNARCLYDWDRIALRWEEDMRRWISGRDPHEPAYDVGLDLLDPLLLTDSLLNVEVPAALAETWIREIWSSYGYNPNYVPGLPTA